MIIYFPSAPDLESKLDAAEAKYGQQAQRTDKFKTIAWFKLSDAKKKVKAKSSPAGKWLSTFSKKTRKWAANPVDAFYMSEAKADAKNLAAKPKSDKAAAAAAAAFAKAEAGSSWRKRKVSPTRN